MSFVNFRWVDHSYNRLFLQSVYLFEHQGGGGGAYKNVNVYSRKWALPGTQKAFYKNNVNSTSIKRIKALCP